MYRSKADGHHVKRFSLPESELPQITKRHFKVACGTGLHRISLSYSPGRRLESIGLHWHWRPCSLDAATDVGSE